MGAFSFAKYVDKAAVKFLLGHSNIIYVPDYNKYDAVKAIMTSARSRVCTMIVAVVPVLNSGAAESTGSLVIFGGNTILQPFSPNSSFPSVLHDGTFTTEDDSSYPVMGLADEIHHSYYGMFANVQVRIVNDSDYEIYVILARAFKREHGTPSINDIADTAGRPTYRELIQMPRGHHTALRLLPKSASYPNRNIGYLRMSADTLKMIPDFDNIDDISAIISPAATPVKNYHFELAFAAIGTSTPDKGAEPTQTNVYFETKIDQVFLAHDTRLEAMNYETTN